MAAIVEPTIHMWSSAGGGEAEEMQATVLGSEPATPRVWIEEKMYASGIMN